MAKRDGFNSIVRYISLCFVARFILFSTVMSCVVGSSLARIGLPRSCCKANVVKDDQTWSNMVWCLEVVFFSRHSPHDEDGEADKDEKGATDSDHGKCPEVDLAIP